MATKLKELTLENLSHTSFDALGEAVDALASKAAQLVAKDAVCLRVWDVLFGLMLLLCRRGEANSLCRPAGVALLVG